MLRWIQKPDARLLVVTVLLTAVVFGLDLMTPRGFAEEMLYTAVVFLATQGLHRRTVLLTASLCTVLTVIGFMVSPAGLSIWVSLTNRGFSVAAIWAIALLTLQRKRAEEALQTSEDKFRLVVASTRDYAIIMLDADGRIASWNAGAKQVYRYTSDEILAQPFTVLFPLDGGQAERPDALLVSARREGRAQEEGWRVRKDGSRFWGHTSLSPIFDERRQLCGYAAVTRDLTERKQAEDTIQTLARIAEKLNSTLDIEVLLGELVAESILLVNGESGQVGLASEEGMVGQKLVQEGHMTTYRKVWEPGEGLPGWVSVHKAPYLTNDAWNDPQIDPLLRQHLNIKSAVSVPVMNAADEVIGFFEIYNKSGSSSFTTEDQSNLVAVSEAASIAIQNAVAYQKLQRAQTIHTHLLNRIITAQEEERSRIGRELHDEIGQLLTSLLVGLRTLEESHHGSAVKADAGAIRRLAGQALEEIRRLARGLRPTILDDLGLEDAISRYTSEYMHTHGIPVDFHMQNSRQSRLPHHVETALYRIVQEALTNAARHAVPSQISILVQAGDSHVQLIIEDDGKGFRVEDMQLSTQSIHHLGLHSIQERVELLNGHISIESSPGKGTAIYVTIPLSPLASTPGTQ